MDLNRASILGRLTRDPEVRSTPSGRPVANITVVTNMAWKDQSGNKQEKAEFHNCVLWGRLAEIAGQYLTKGRRVFVEGRIETRSWDAQDGNKKYKTEIIVRDMIMLDGTAGKAGTNSPSQSYGSTDTEDNLPTIQHDEEISVDDIPF